MLADFSSLTLNPGYPQEEPEIPAPDISSPGVVALDVTEKFISAAKSEIYSVLSEGPHCPD